MIISPVKFRRPITKLRSKIVSRRPNPFKSRLWEKSEVRSGVRRFPKIPKRRPILKVSLDSIKVDEATATKRQRARERIKALFERKRPLFERPKLVSSNGDEVSDQTSEAHRFVTKTKLDSMTYVGFVDFTTTVDDKVLIFKPKQTFSTQETRTRNLLRPVIEPTRTVGIISASSRHPAFSQPPELDSSSKTSLEDEIARENFIDEDDQRKHTSGIDALKSLLSSSRKNKFGLGRTTAGFGSSSRRSSVRPSLARPSAVLSSSAVPEISPSIDPTSDVEVVFKTLYTTHTYFTTFFRDTTTRTKSREEVTSEVLTITITNLLKLNDLPSISNSCAQDSSCVFKSADTLDEIREFTDGHIGRPSSKIVEKPRSGNGKLIGVDAAIKPTSLDELLRYWEPAASFPLRRLEISSVRPVPVPTLEDQDDGVFIVTQETPALTTDLVEEVTIAASISETANMFTFYTTRYDGEETIVETIYSTSGPVSTAVPEIQSGEAEVDIISVSTIATPSSASTISPTNTFQDNEDKDKEDEEEEEEEVEEGVKPSRTRAQCGVSFSRPGNIFTDIRPVRPSSSSNSSSSSYWEPSEARQSGQFRCSGQTDRGTAEEAEERHRDHRAPPGGLQRAAL